MFFRHVAGLINVWRAASRPLQTVWRVLPGDLLGLLVIRACGIRGVSRQIRVGDLTADLVEHPNVARYLDHGAMPIRAQTLGRYVFAREPLSPQFVEHELEHVRQWQRLGPLFLPAYLASSVSALARHRHPYWTNRFEVSARRREAQSHHPIAKT
jgi:hypothetical protein